MTKSIRIAAWILITAVTTSCADAPNPGGRPNLVMTKPGVETIRAERGNVPLFDASVEAVRSEVDAEIEMGIDTPVPRRSSAGLDKGGRGACLVRSHRHLTRRAPMESWHHPLSNEVVFTLPVSTGVEIGDYNVCFQTESTEPFEAVQIVYT